jgi:hypothetical protein
VKLGAPVFAISFTLVQHAHGHVHEGSFSRPWWDMARSAGAVETHASVAAPRISHVIPEREHGLVRGTGCAAHRSSLSLRDGRRPHAAPAAPVHLSATIAWRGWRHLSAPRCSPLEHDRRRIAEVAQPITGQIDERCAPRRVVRVEVSSRVALRARRSGYLYISQRRMRNVAAGGHAS